MSLFDILSVTTGGVRSALSLLAVMALIVAWHTPKPEGRIDIYRSRTGVLFALACATFSPAHAAFLLQHPLPPCVARGLDLAATALGCIALIHMLAARAIQRGVPMFRVRRAMFANASIVISFIGVAWIMP